MALVLAIRAIENDMGRRGPALLGVWIYFNLVVNTILLPLLVATFLFSSRARRHPTLVNLCITWIFSGEFSILLFYAKQHVGPEPTPSLCIAQASLLYGITPMWSVAVLMLFYYMAMAVRCGPKNSSIRGWRLVFMLTSPYIAQVSFSLAAFFISLNHPKKVTRALRYLYCALENSKLSLGNSIFTLLMCIAIIFLEVHLGIIAYRNHCGLRIAGKCSNGVDYQFYLRVLIFGGYVTFGMVVNIVSIFFPGSVIPDIYAATAGTAVFLVFGTQPDVLNVWRLWIRVPQNVPLPIYIDKCTSWRRVEPPEPSKVADDVENVPPLPPPKSREYLISRGLQNSIKPLPLYRVP